MLKCVFSNELTEQYQMMETSGIGVFVSRGMTMFFPTRPSVCWSTMNVRGRWRQKGLDWVTRAHHAYDVIAELVESQYCWKLHGKAA